VSFFCHSCLVRIEILWPAETAATGVPPFSGQPGLVAGSALKIEALEHDNINQYQ
jgi:hypothetical protein